MPSPLAGKGCLPWGSQRAGAASSLVPAALHHSQLHPAPAAPRERSPSILPREKPCPEHLTLLGAPADVSPLGHGSKGSWKRRSPMAPGTTFPGLTWSLPFEVTLQPRPLLWGTGLSKTGRARGMPGKGIYVRWLPARLSLSHHCGSWAGLLPPDLCTSPQPARGHKLPRVTQHRGLAWEKTSGLGGTGLRPTGQSLGARRGQSSPGSKGCSQNPPGEGVFEVLVLGGSCL